MFAPALAIASGALAPTVTPAPNGEKPGDPPTAVSSELGKAAAEQKRSTWTKNMKACLDCLRRFVDEHQAAAAPHLKAANAAVDQFDKSIKIFNEQIEAARTQ